MTHALPLVLMLAAASLALVSPAAADDDPPSCSGELDVQTDPNGNTWECEGDCHGNIVVQVGLRNRIECGGNTCVGNLFVQAGLDNDALLCITATGQVLTAYTQSEAVADRASDDAPCPSVLPPDNFWCYAVDVLEYEIKRAICEAGVIPYVCPEEPSA